MRIQELEKSAVTRAEDILAQQMWPKKFQLEVLMKCGHNQVIAFQTCEVRRKEWRTKLKSFVRKECRECAAETWERERPVREAEEAAAHQESSERGEIRVAKFRNEHLKAIGEGVALLELIEFETPEPKLQLLLFERTVGHCREWRMQRYRSAPGSKDPLKQIDQWRRLLMKRVSAEGQ